MAEWQKMYTQLAAGQTEPPDYPESILELSADPTSAGDITRDILEFTPDPPSGAPESGDWYAVSEYEEELTNLDTYEGTKEYTLENIYWYPESYGYPPPYEYSASSNQIVGGEFLYRYKHYDWMDVYTSATGTSGNNQWGVVSPTENISGTEVPAGRWCMVSATPTGGTIASIPVYDVRFRWFPNSYIHPPIYETTIFVNNLVELDNETSRYDYKEEVKDRFPLIDPLW